MKQLLFCLILLLSLSANANVTKSFVPENSFYVPTYSLYASTVEEYQFNYNIDLVNKAYKSVLENYYNATLKFERKWSDGTVNAYAKQTGNVWIIAMFGGLARHNLMTSDGFRAVICHEMGHHIGGAPKYSSWWGGDQWAAAEGQADYFATSKCLKRTFDEEDEEITIGLYERAKSSEELYAKEKCSEVFSMLYDKASCYRASIAGIVLANVLNSLRDPIVLSLKTPDLKEIEKTNTTGYPGIQCRMDSYFQGALCDNDITELSSATDPAQGYCVRDVGARPKCWFKASDYDL